MLTNIASHSTPRVRAIQISASRSKVLGPVGVSLLKTRHRQQTRAYRFGMWSSYLDPEFHRDMRRRHRTLRYKYAETINRRLSWEQNPSAEDSKAALRRMAGRYWYPGEAHCGNRFVTSDEGIHKREKRGSDTSANNGWVNSSSKPVFRSDSDSWKSQLDDLVNQWTKQASRGARRAKADLSSAPLHPVAKDQPKERENAPDEYSSAEQEYVIDPISNRKVPKNTYGFDADTTAIAGEKYKHSLYTDMWAPYNSPPMPEAQDQSHPVYSDGPPPAAELERYAKMKIDSLPAASSQQPEVDTANATSTAETDKAQDAEVHSEEYTLNHLPPEELVEKYEDLDKYKPEQYDEVERPTELPNEEYEDLDKYKPDKYDEVERPVELPNEEYEDLDKYKPEKYDEVDRPVELPNEEYQDLDKYKPDKYDEIERPVETANEEYDDLHKYKPFMHDENGTVEESKQYEDLDKYEYEHQEDTKLDEPAPEYDDLDKYKPTEFPDGVKVHEPTPEYEDLDKYDKPFHYEEDKPESNSDPKYEDLDKYGSSDKPFQQYGDLDSYKAYRFQEPDGKAAQEQDIVADCLKEYDIKSASREDLEQSMDGHITASDAADREASAGILRSRQRAQGDNMANLTGNFVRDFPEEFSTSWGSSREGLQPKGTSSSSCETYPKGLQGLHTPQEQDHSADTSRIQPALSRQEPTVRRNLERSSTTPSATPNAEPTVYKVLAYDPNTQDINIAETTSIVSDQATPLTPAEVLLRLSSPAKFLPYFGPLQNQGFEIVSGSGDILVFRRVRTGSNTMLDSPQATTSSRSTNPVNPIDMMGRVTALPNAASFASPTGFVNYDGVPFRSNIDVRREEPVFSGQKAYTQDGETFTKDGKRIKGKRSFTKRLLIGGVWVAGVTYALGVVGQFFATGGMDGRGPTGF
jgi:hypothetical protein